MEADVPSCCPQLSAILVQFLALSQVKRGIQRVASSSRISTSRKKGHSSQVGAAKPAWVLGLMVAPEDIMPAL